MRARPAEGCGDRPRESISTWRPGYEDSTIGSMAGSSGISLGAPLAACWPLRPRWRPSLACWRAGVLAGVGWWLVPLLWLGNLPLFVVFAPVRPGRGRLRGEHCDGGEHRVVEKMRRNGSGESASFLE